MAAAQALGVRVKVAGWCFYEAEAVLVADQRWFWYGVQPPKGFESVMGRSRLSALEVSAPWEPYSRVRAVQMIVV